MMRKTLLAAVLTFTAMAAHADYQCSVTPRDDVILSPQTVQVKGENGDLVITQAGDVTFNGKQYNLNAAQREQAKDYQAALRSSLPWIDEGARARVEKGRVALDKIIAKEVGESSNMRGRLTKLDAQLKEQMNRIIEHRTDGLTSIIRRLIKSARTDNSWLIRRWAVFCRTASTKWVPKPYSKAVVIRCRACSGVSVACKPQFRTNGRIRNKTSSSLAKMSVPAL